MAIRDRPRRRPPVVLAAVSALAVVAAWVGVSAKASPSHVAATSFQPQAPITAAFFYPWYPSHWTEQGVFPYTNYTPSLGWYDSMDPATYSEQLALAERAHLEAFIVSWWEPGEVTDTSLQHLLGLTLQMDSRLRLSAYYEPEGYGDPVASQIAADLQYMQAHLFSSPAYLRYGGVPVLFVYGTGAEDCAMSQRWAAAEALAGVDVYVVLKVFPGYTACPVQPDSWHQYSPTSAFDQQMPYSASISPGFWKYGESPILARNPSHFEYAAQWLVATQATWQLVTTWNEWAEGTAVEPAMEYGTTYVDILCRVLPGPAPCEGPTPSPLPPTPASSPTATTTGSPGPTAPPVGGTPSPTPTGDETEPSGPPPAGTPTQTPQPSGGMSPPAGPTQSPGKHGPAPVRGDANCDLRVSAQDAVAILRLVLRYGQAGGCLDAAGLLQVADVDCDGQVNARDALIPLLVAASVSVLVLCGVPA